MNWFFKIFKLNTATTNLPVSKNISYSSFEKYKKGEKLYQEKKYKEALECYDKALSSGYNNSYGEIFKSRAFCLQEFDFHYDAILDFDKAIELLKTDCHLYYTRAISKCAVLDYLGQYEDLTKAYELAQEDNEQNKDYDKKALGMGYSNGVRGVMWSALSFAKWEFENEVEKLEKIKNCETEENTAYWQRIYDVDRERKLLKRVKTR